jgi:alginate O-acetyltransferase complex protein AlgI
VSLSTWLRDYLYIPLGGNRKGEGRTYVNLALVMLLGGLWHGASWNFVIWGGIHGAMLAVERMQGKQSFYHSLPKALRVALTFFIVCVAWVFFRAPTLPEALRYCGSMFGVHGAQGGAALIAGLIYQPYYLIMMGAAAAITWTCPQTWDFTRRMPWWKVPVIFGAFLAAVLVLTTQEFNPFIYFIF